MGTRWRVSRASAPAFRATALRFNNNYPIIGQRMTQETQGC